MTSAMAIYVPTCAHAHFFGTCATECIYFELTKPLLARLLAPTKRYPASEQLAAGACLNMKLEPLQIPRHARPRVFVSQRISD